MSKVKTHSFRLGKYYIDEDRDIEGYCDQPDTYYNLRMVIMGGKDYKALSSALHEALHAEGIPDKYLHKGDGTSDTERIARFLWRLGWRRR
jgi:hypothetical protein